MNKIWQLPILDLKLIFRDTSLRTFLVLPILIYGVVFWFLPYLIKTYPVVENYILYVLMACITQIAQMFGFIYGLIFIEEKETGVAKVFGVSPVAKAPYLLSRLSFAFIFSVIFNFVLVLFQPFFDIAILPALIYSLVAGLIVFVYPIGLSICSKNKMAGLTFIKLFNALAVLPIVSYFIPPALKHITGFIPTHWLFRAFEDMAMQQNFGLHLSIATLLLLLLLAFVLSRFVNKHYQ